MKRVVLAVLTVIFITSSFTGAEAAKKTNKKTANAPAKQASQGTELDRLRGQMTSTLDEIEGIKWIYDKTTKKLLNSGRFKTFFCVYLGQKQDTGYMWPRFLMGFTKSDWVFFKKIIVNNDGDVDTLDFGSFSTHRDTFYGGILEEIDLAGGDYEELIKKVIGSKKTMIRFKGDNYSHDFTLPDEQRAALSRIWRLYELMKK